MPRNHEKEGLEAVQAARDATQHALAEAEKRRDASHTAAAQADEQVAVCQRDLDATQEKLDEVAASAKRQAQEGHRAAYREALARLEKALATTIGRYNEVARVREEAHGCAELPYLHAAGSTLEPWLEQVRRFLGRGA